MRAGVHPIPAPCHGSAAADRPPHPLPSASPQPQSPAGCRGPPGASGRRPFEADGATAELDLDRLGIPPACGAQWDPRGRWPIPARSRFPTAGASRAAALDPAGSIGNEPPPRRSGFRSDPEKHRGPGLLAGKRGTCSARHPGTAFPKAANSLTEWAGAMRIRSPSPAPLSPHPRYPALRRGLQVAGAELAVRALSLQSTRQSVPGAP